MHFNTLYKHLVIVSQTTLELAMVTFIQYLRRWWPLSSRRSPGPILPLSVKVWTAGRMCGVQIDRKGQQYLKAVKVSSSSKMIDFKRLGNSLSFNERERYTTNTCSWYLIFSTENYKIKFWRRFYNDILGFYLIHYWYLIQL